MKALYRFAIVLVIGLLLAALIAGSKGILSQTEPVRIFHILCDGFFVVGVVITSAGLLVFSSNEGTFDMLVYGVSSFLDLFRQTSKKKYETFYDYRSSRSEKKIKFGFILIAGLFFLAVSMVMYALYRMYK